MFLWYHSIFVANLISLQHQIKSITLYECKYHGNSYPYPIYVKYTNSILSNYEISNISNFMKLRNFKWNFMKLPNFVETTVVFYKSNFINYDNYGNSNFVVCHSFKKLLFTYFGKITLWIPSNTKCTVAYWHQIIWIDDKILFMAAVVQQQLI